MAKMPEYILDQEYRYGPMNDPQILPQGSFVKPIEYMWVPKHVIDGEPGKYFNKLTDMFYYTKYGFVAIPTKYVRKID